MIFKIRKGKHRNIFKWFFPFFTFKKKLKCSICLLGDHKYYFNTKDEQIKTNKLVGLSDNYYHRKDSIRIGYRFYNNKYDLMVYYYNNSENLSQVIGEIHENLEFNIEFEILNDKYLVKYDGNVYYFNRTSKWKLLRYYTYPYFGGENPSPKDIEISIVIKK